MRACTSSGAGRIAAASLIKDELCLLDVPRLDRKAKTFGKGVRLHEKVPQAPPALVDEMRADVAGAVVAFTAGADMEFVIGQYTHGFEEAFNTFEEKVRPPVLELLGTRTRRRRGCWRLEYVATTTWRGRRR